MHVISKTYKTLAASILVFGLAIGAEMPTATAQDDWDVKRDPFDRSLISRYKALLRKNPDDSGTLSKLSRMYRRYRSIELLVGEFEKELEAAPKSFSLLVILGHLETERGNADAGLAYYERAAEEKPGDAGVQVAVGDLLRSASKTAEAKAAYEKGLKAVKDKKLEIRIRQALADIALDTGDIDAAIKHYEAYFKLDPQNVQAQIDFGDALSRYDRFKEAIEAYRAAEKRLGTDPMLRVKVVERIGQIYERDGKPDEAIKEYKRGIGMISQGYYLRRDLTERIIGIHRERDQLKILLAEFEKEWSPGSRGHFEWDVIARLLEETGNQDKALGAYKEAVKKSPYELDTQRRLINLLETTGREKEAIVQYEQVIRVAPSEPRFQLDLAQRYMAAGQEKKALAMLKKIASSFSGDPGVIAALADLYGRWGKPDEALDAYQKLTKIEPDDARHLVNLGDQYFQRSDQKKALAIWKKIARKGDAESHATLAQVYADHDLSALALETYTRAIEIDATKPAYYQGRARVYDRQRRFAQAISDWEKALELTPDKEVNETARREARRQIVNLLARTSDRTLTSRIAVWARAFAATPPDIGAGYFLVEAHIRRAKNDKALIVLEKLLVHNPKDSQAMHELVKVYREQREYDKAVALLKRLLEANPSRGHEYYTQIAEIMTAQRRDDDAIFYQQKAVEKSPNDPRGLIELAKRYVEMNRYDDAVAAYEKALKLAPNNAQGYFELANLYGFRNDREREAKLYVELLARAGEEEILLRAGRAATNLAENVGKLDVLERALAPLAFTHSHKPVYRFILVELYGRYVPLLNFKRTFGDAKERTEAEEELRRLGSHGLKPLLDALADDKDGQQQRIAVSVLGYMGNKAAAPPLVRLATESDSAPTRVGSLVGRGVDWNVRVDALVAAGRLGDPRILPNLLALRDHREVAMREAAIFALGMTGDPKAIAPLAEALKDRRESVRTLACLGFARIADKKTADAVLTVLSNQSESDVTRAACAYAAGATAEKSATRALLEALKQGNDHTQRIAAYALGRLADPQATDGLIAAYFAKRGRVRDTVAWALARTLSGEPDKTPALSDFEYVPRYGKFDQEQAIESLAIKLDLIDINIVALLGQEKALVGGIRAALARHRDLLVRILSDLDGREGALGIGALTATVSSLPAGERERVEAALRRIGTELAPEIAKLTTHEDLEVQRRALSVLAKLGDRQYRGVLEAALVSDSLPRVRAAARSAATYFAVAKDAEITSALATLLGDSAKLWSMRLAACESLATFHHQAAAGAALATALREDANAPVRICAADALGRVGAPGAEEALSSRSSKEIEADPSVRAAIARALHWLGTPSARAAAAEMAKADPNIVLPSAAGSAPKNDPSRKK